MLPCPAYNRLTYRNIPLQTLGPQIEYHNEFSSKMAKKHYTRVNKHQI